MHIETKTPFYKLTIDHRTERTDLVILSREGAAPVVGGLLERMVRPGGGEAATWTDARASKESVGGGYTRDAVPAEWGFPKPQQPPPPTAWPFTNLHQGEAWSEAKAGVGRAIAAGDITGSKRWNGKEFF